MAERSSIRNLPFPCHVFRYANLTKGFYAKPAKANDGSLDLMRWEAGIPGKAGTSWENGLFKLSLLFPEGTDFLRTSLIVEYPTRPPKCTYF